MFLFDLFLLGILRVMLSCVRLTNATRAILSDRRVVYVCVKSALLLKPKILTVVWRLYSLSLVGVKEECLLYFSLPGDFRVFRHITRWWGEGSLLNGMSGLSRLNETDFYLLLVGFVG